MLFNTFEFAVFFIIVYFLYLVLNHRWQNYLLLIASYIFYGYWDIRALGLLYTSTIVDYFCGIKIDESKNLKEKKLFLTFSICTHLSILGFFKYFNFFSHNLQNIFHALGIHTDIATINILLPIGISFYTFKSISYTVDVYRNEIKPTKNIFDFALFVAFFPQLIAGPIDRAKDLLVQVINPRKLYLDGFIEGAFLIFWGLYEKVVIADNLATIVNPVFDEIHSKNGFLILIALYCYAFQIFCDFDGYSNMARGLAKLMGFNLVLNFNLPYFSTNPSEFWKRWHISLSSWLRDYLYIPLGGSKYGNLMTFRNLMITMLLGGLWHGAAWKFILWGGYQGILLVLQRILEPFYSKINIPKGNKLWFVFRVVFFFQFICLGWLFFRANSISQVLELTTSIFNNFYYDPIISIPLITLISSTIVLITIQIFQYKSNDLLFLLKLKPAYQIAIYLFIFYSLILHGVIAGQEFIYFQF